MSPGWSVWLPPCKHWIYSDFIFLPGNNPCSNMSGGHTEAQSTSPYFISPVIDCKTLFYDKHNDWHESRKWVWAPQNLESTQRSCVTLAEESSELTLANICRWQHVWIFDCPKGSLQEKVTINICEVSGILLTVVWVGRRQDHAVHPSHLFHLVGNLVNESSDFFHLNQQITHQCVLQTHHPGSCTDTHPSEKALHEAISVYCHCNILLCLGPALCWRIEFFF